MTDSYTATDMIDRARIYATEAHQRINHRRKYNNEPYHVHLSAVARIVASVTDDPNVIAAAWLHDTVEDTQATLEDIESSFGVAVAELVEELTDISKPGDGNRARRKAIDLFATCPVAIPRLADIGQFLHQFGHGYTKGCLNILQCGLRVLDSVMQPGSGNYVLVIGDRRNNPGHFTEVYVVWLIIVLSAVVDALVRLGCINTRTVHQVGSCRRVSHNIEPQSL